MRDTVRPWLAFVSLALITVIGLAGLAQLKYSSFLSDSIGERLEIVATTAARDLGSATDLGLRIEAVANGAQILERARAHDPTISTMTVFGLDGEILHHVGDAKATSVHPKTLEAFKLALLEEADDWNVEADGLIRSGAVVAGSFGQPVAGVVAQYPVTELREQEGSMLRSLLGDVAIVVTLLLAVALIGFVLFARSRRNAHGPVVKP